MASAGERISSASGDAYLNLCFYAGDSGFFADPAETHFLRETAGDFQTFWDSAVYYGVFTVSDNDEVRITEMPAASHGVAAALETGAYTDLVEWVETRTAGGLS